MIIKMIMMIMMIICFMKTFAYGAIKSPNSSIVRLYRYINTGRVEVSSLFLMTFI